MNYHALTVALLLPLSISPAQSQTPEQSPETLEKRVKALEKRLNALENIPAIAMALKMAGQAQSAAAEIPTLKSKRTRRWKLLTGPWTGSLANNWTLFAYVTHYQSQGLTPQLHPPRKQYLFRRP